MTAPSIIGFGSYYAPQISAANFPANTIISGPSAASRGYSVDFSQDGTMVAYGTVSDGLVLYSLPSWTPITSPLTGTTVSGVKFSPDSTKLAVATWQDPFFRVYDVSDWSYQSPAAVKARNGYATDWSLDGNYIVHSHNLGNPPGYQVWDAATLNEITGYPNTSAGDITPLDIAVSERSSVIAVAYGTSPFVTVIDLVTKAILWESIDTFSFNANNAKPMALSPDGNVLAVTSQSAPYLRLYDARTGAVYSGGPSGGDLPNDRSLSADWSLDQQYLVIGHWKASELNSYSYWDTATWTKTSINLAGVGDAVLSIAFNGAEGVAPPSAVQNAIMHGMEF